MPLSPDDIHIESPRLSIRPFSAGDAEETFCCITSSLTRFMAWDPPADRSAFEQVWREWLSTIADGTDYTFAIRRRDSGGFVGLTGLHDVRITTAELGVWIREDFHAQGFGREAVRSVAKWASSVVGIATFIYPVAEPNYASRRIAEGLGGVVESRRDTPKYRSVIYRIPDQAGR